MTSPIRMSPRNSRKQRPRCSLLGGGGTASSQGSSWFSLWLFRSCFRFSCGFFRCFLCCFTLPVGGFGVSLLVVPIFAIRDFACRFFRDCACFLHSGHKGTGPAPDSDKFHFVAVWEALASILFALVPAIRKQPIRGELRRVA